MPRQKQIVSEIKRNVIEDVKPEVETKSENAAKKEISESDESPNTGSELSSDDGYDLQEHLSIEELVQLAQEAEKSGDIEQAVTLCDTILTRRCRDLEDETNPELGEHWLNYGNVLLTREEMSGELFSSSKEQENENLEIAWNSLDLARICLEKDLDGVVNKETTDIVDFCSHCLNNDEYLNIPLVKIDANTQRKVSLLRFAHLRMGDFKQGSHDYQEAAEEFSTSLQLSVRYCEDISKALAAGIPLTQCFMALDHEGTANMFDLCMRLIELELKRQDVSEDRKSLLVETQADLKLQLEDFQQHRTEVLDELKKLFLQNENDDANTTLRNSRKRPEPDRNPDVTQSPGMELNNTAGELAENQPVQDLGRLGKKRSHDS